MPRFFSKSIGRLNPTGRPLKVSSPVALPESNLAPGLEPELGNALAACDPPATSVAWAGSGPGLGQGDKVETQEKAKSSKSLWDRAYDDLRTEKRELVEDFEAILMSEPEIELTTSLDDVDTSEREKLMSALVDKKLEVMSKRQWRVRMFGKPVQIREQVDRIAKVVLIAKDFIPSAATMGPLHAGLPWAGVCMLVPLLVNDSKQRAATIDGLEYISTLVRRYAEIERIYLQGGEHTLKADRSEECMLRKELEIAIMKLYRQVLEYEARAVCQFNRNTALQIGRNIVEADGWGDIVGSMKASEMTCDELMRVIDAEDRQERIIRLESATNAQNCRVDEQLCASRKRDEELLAEIETTRKDQKELFKTKEQEGCLKSLRTTLYEDNMEKNPDRVPGTCEWFLRHPKYCEWLDGSASNLLLVTADPECGKSVLSKFLINYYKSWLWIDTAICYFFFKDDSDKNRSATHALCAILHQLFRQNPSLLEHAIPEYKSNGEKLPELFGSLWDILMKVAADANSGNIVCVLDALDECAESSCGRLIEYLARFHSDTRGTARIKFLITGRPNAFTSRVFSQHFSRLNQDLSSIKLMGENERELEEISVEINLVIDAKEDFRKQRRSDGIDDNAHVAVQGQLKMTENRTYLWMSLIFPVVEAMAGNAEDALLEAIKRIPNTVYEAYERILASSCNEDTARTLLHIVCAASRPLTLAEMNRALSVYGNCSLTPSKSFPRLVRELCGLFVSIQNNRVYLIHQTAKEFLILEGATGGPVRPIDSIRGPWKHSLEPTESNLILAKICASYLLYPAFESDPLAIDHRDRFADVQKVRQYTEEHDFLFYSANNWASHVREAKIQEETMIPIALKVCDTQSPRFLTWFYVYWVTAHHQKRYPQDLTGLMVGSYLGLEVIVKLLLEKPVDVDLKDIRYDRTPLSWAVWNGHEAVVKLLLEGAADVNSKDIDGRTPLLQAVEMGHEAIVKLLLKEAVEVDFKDGFSRTPLLRAAANGHEAVVKLLLVTTADVNSKDIGGRTSLSWATEKGHKTVAKLLESKGQ
ncbi:MAG: hypothetical protein M1840_001482 [Geoglossum simile]|nr:MAG: hypothetical protein M1840_001482 [Geoglossum simile]